MAGTESSKAKQATAWFFASALALLVCALNFFEVMKRHPRGSNTIEAVGWMAIGALCVARGVKAKHDSKMIKAGEMQEGDI
jgi:hypothetical protein